MNSSIKNIKQFGVFAVLLIVAVSISGCIEQNSETEKNRNIIHEVDELNLDSFCLGIKYSNVTLRGDEGYIVYCNQTVCVWTPWNMCHVFQRS